MKKQIWCPYSGRNIDTSESTSEHIIPLSLGGSNAFVLPVDRLANSQLGTKADGFLANDFFTVLRRIKYNAVGHSRKAPEAQPRKARVDGNFAKIVFDRAGFRVWDLQSRILVPPAPGTQINFVVPYGHLERLWFLAKVALSAGYFCFGEEFRQHVQHAGLRDVLLARSIAEMQSTLQQTGIGGYTEHMLIAEEDEDLVLFEQDVCKTLPGSVVYCSPGPQNIAIGVGILGQWVGTLNIPATTHSLPYDGDYDLGHAIVLQHRTMTRMSFRALLQRSIAPL